MERNIRNRTECHSLLEIQFHRNDSNDGSLGKIMTILAYKWSLKRICSLETNLLFVRLDQYKKKKVRHWRLTSMLINQFQKLRSLN